MSVQDIISYVLQTSIVELSQVVFSETPQLIPCKDSISCEESKITASIGLTGSLSASLALSTDSLSACRLLSKMLGTDIQGINQDTIDGVAELLNMLAGVAKTKFSEKSYSLNLSLPTIITGSVVVSVHQIIKSDGVSYSVQLKDTAFDVYFFYSVDDGSQVNNAQSTAGATSNSSGQKAA